MQYLDLKHWSGPKPAHLKGVKYGPPLPPGFKKTATSQLIQSSSRRRRGRRNGKKRNNSSHLNQGSRSTDAPVNFSNTTCIRESDFKTKPIRSEAHGPGIEAAFSVALASVGSNGVTTTNTADYQNAISIVGIGSAIIASGFITADGNWTSGLLEHPLAFGARMQRESQNWTEWQPASLTYSYQNLVATSATGQFIMSHTRDPDDFIEATGPQTAPTHSYSNLTQNIPNCSTNVYKDMSLTLNKWDRTKYYPTEVGVGTPFAPGQNVATLAYNNTHYCGRFVLLYNGPPQTITAGVLWLHGVIRFFGPSASQLSIGTTVTSLSFDKPTVYFRGKWRTMGYVRKLQNYLIGERSKQTLLPVYEELDFKEEKTGVPDIEDLHLHLPRLNLSTSTTSSTSIGTLPVERNRKRKDSPDDW